jgi:dihydrodipicolinate synthase/N-acetylneuraminate lyase
MVSLCRAIQEVQYVKEERLLRQADYISEIITLGGGDVRGVFSGGWSLTLCAAYRRGAAGVMRGTSVPEVGAHIWNLLEQGNEEQARQIESALAVLDRAKMGVQTIQGVKQLLVMRGIFSSSALRNSAPRVMDEHHIYELKCGLQLLEPYLMNLP